ncbi:hypothetical protein Lsai_2134 [Legionella sainthelensi]|uniref:DUF2569 domain-containing protein n=1 Tax=Legionella sainthelensi TaxID=28087 RepID=A0A0W0YH91_9GAMM|nr:hypothetical protein [Legionella sainthelensi]KTD56004.1 hypothetical protein Lsai_2134 [Legionella sainthelensi]VEH28850.1 Uncharacterised protein [Legionella sainthelensi]
MYINTVTERSFRIFAQGIILMWALWISIVFLTDFCNLMVGFDLLPADFPASSHNLDWIHQFLKLYWLDNDRMCLILFSIINLWVMAIAVLYWRAFISYYTCGKYYVYRVMQAFILNMSLFVCFLVTDEIFIQYQAGHSHMNMLLYMFTSLIAFLYLLDKNNQKSLT